MRFHSAIIRRVIPLVMSLTLPSLAIAQQRTATSASLDSIVRATLATSVAPGMSVAIVRGKDTLLLKGYGFADVERNVAVSPATIFRAGSVTKEFTAAAILRLVQDGRLTLDETLGRALPDYDGPGKAVTIRQLLSHTSGIPNFTQMGAQVSARARRATSQREVRALFEAAPLEFEPGSRWAYNNSGFFLLGGVIEKASGVPYAEYLASKVIGPAGLRDTRDCDDKSADARRAFGYDGNRGSLERAGPVTGVVPFSAGSLCATARDLVIWQRRLAAGAVISPHLYSAMTTPVKLNDGRAQSYGFGIEVAELGGHVRVGHGGSISGFDSHVAHYPQDDLTIAVLTNNTAANAEGIEKRLARHILGLPDVVATRVALSAAERARYVGSYDVGGGRLRILEQRGALRVAGPVDAEIVYQGANTFVLAEEPDVKVVFQVENDRVVSLDWTSRGRTLRARKVD
jgi:D-alanyl-D-alanine carboxypeptidase